MSQLSTLAEGRERAPAESGCLPESERCRWAPRDARKLWSQNEETYRRQGEEENSD